MKFSAKSFLLAFGLAGASLAPASQPTSLSDLPDSAPDAEKAGFVIPPGFEISLWASDPMIRKPVQMNWDSKGRLWVVSSTTYPQIKPGEENIDQVVVLEDTKHAGKADKATVFADGLHIPTALMPADGGCYVANSTEILFLKDTKGTGKADYRETVLSGFGTEDTHHLIHTFRFTPEGMISFNQSIYIHSHVETPYGVERLMGGGVWEYRPETKKLKVFCKGFINPWGREFDRWGQSFVTDGAGSDGINFVFPESVFATSPGAKRIMPGLNPGQPKQAGLEIVDEPHFPNDWQGTLITCDFRGNRINHFKLTESGSGYLSKQLPDVLASTHRGFRPIDVRIGPDGALYIADWYNPIIQHGEVDFRDPRRDHVHGRIWRLTVKGRPLSESPDFAKLSVEGVLKELSSPRRWNRLFAKRELRDRNAAEVLAALNKATAAAPSAPAPAEAGAELAPPSVPLELAWARENVRDYDVNVVANLLKSPDHHVRAGALRILSEQLSDTPNAMDLLRPAIADEHPQVRLWAVACLSLMSTPDSFALALHALDKDVDNNIDFLLDFTAREQASVWLPVFLSGSLKFENSKHLVYALKATGKAEALPPLLEAFTSGKLSAEDNAAVLAAAGDSASPAQLSELLQFAFKDSMKGQQTAILDSLIKAGQRRAQPASGAAEAATKLLASSDQELSTRGCLLAGLWKLEAERPKLAEWASQATASPALREAAVRGLTYLGGGKTRDLFDQLAKGDQPAATRALAISGLSDLAPALGAKHAAEFLASAKTPEEVRPVIEAFIKNKKLPDVLAGALKATVIPERIAVEGLRMVSTRGVKGGLQDALQKAGQIKQMTQTLTPDQMNAMVAKVKAQGDAHRGELVFRRQQMLCYTCHAIGEAGGTLGPNLVSLGASAPVDYIVESILEPSKKIKEGYHMTIVTTKDGQIVAGMVQQETGDELIIRDAGNALHHVAKATIASKQISPVSMMPPGLTASLREDEFVDLVKFLSELGREGDYKIKPTRFVRSWRVMAPMEQVDVDHVRHVGLFALNNRSYKYPWIVDYSLVNGNLPLGDLSIANRMYPWFPKIAQFDLKLDGDGQVKLKLSTVKGIIVAVDDKELQDISEEIPLKLKAGTHVVSIIVETRQAGDLNALSVEVAEGAGQVVTSL